MGEWNDGHLLVHVHEQWGMADSTQLQVLATGAKGIWAGVCAEGMTTLYCNKYSTAQYTFSFGL